MFDISVAWTQQQGRLLEEHLQGIYSFVVNRGAHAGPTNACSWVAGDGTENLRRARTAPDCRQGGFSAHCLAEVVEVDTRIRPKFVAHIARSQIERRDGRTA